MGDIITKSVDGTNMLKTKREVLYFEICFSTFVSTFTYSLS